MRQLRFAIKDIRRNKSYFIRFFLQITCVLVLLGICMSQISSTNHFKTKFNVFQETAQMYIVRDKTDPAVFEARLADESIHTKLYDLHCFLSESQDINFYSYYDDKVFAEKEDIPIRLIQYPDDSKYYPLLYIDQNFWDIFHLSCTDGRDFTQEDFTTMQEQIPIILGYEYNGYYNIGDVIDQEFVVIGILEKDAFYLDPGKTDEVLYLSGTILAPLIVNEETSFYQLDRIILSSTLLVHDTAQLKRIEEKARSIELYDDLEFISFTRQLESIVENNMLFVVFEISIQCLILFFCIICIVSALMNFINVHKKDFAIHILCGACAKDLSLRIVFQIGICMFTSNIIAFIVFGFSQSSFVILLISAGLLLLIVTLPVIKIIRKPLASFLKEV